MPDRSGGREAKGSSLKKSKSNPGCTVAKKKTVPTNDANLLSVVGSAAVPKMLSKDPYIDCASALMSRQFDRDRDRVLSRAKEDGCCAIIEWFSDIEKQDVMADLAKAHSGFLYFVTGIHPNNVDRTNKKSHDGWLDKVNLLGRRAECVGLLSGLNCSRETGTHFAQESLLSSSYKLAVEKLQLPLILHLGSDGASLDRALEVLNSEQIPEDDEDFDVGERDEEPIKSGLSRIVIHDAIAACAGDANRLRQAVSAGCMMLVSAAGLGAPDNAEITGDQSSVIQRTKELLRLIPLGQLLVATDSPWHTPQTLSDPYLRTLRNEPSNLHGVITAVADALGPEVQREALLVALKSNAMRFFNLETAEISTNNDVNNSKETNVQHVNADASAASTEKSTDSIAEQTAGGIAAVAVAESATLPTATPTSATVLTKNLSFFRCKRCSSRLFAQSEVTTHGIDVAKGTSVFKAGEEGLCSAYVFLPVDDSRLTFTNARDGNAECAQCSAKLGRFCPSETACSCGAKVEGPIVKLTAHRVDFVDTSADAATLAARAAMETEENQRQRELDEEAEREAAKSGRKQKAGKGKLKRGDNKGNFSSYRNKSFVPNASRVATAAAAEQGSAENEEEEDGDEDSVS